MNTPRPKGFATRAIHLGYDPYAGAGSLVPPLYQSSTYTFKTVEEGASRFAGESEGFIYGRLGNPTSALLETRLASLEGAEAAVVTSSGMGAICSLFWTIMNPGDELIVDQTLYGCTFSFFHHGLAKFGISIKHVDLTNPENLRAAISEKTKGVYFETPANPNMRVVDIQAVSAIAKEFDLWTAVDNTYMTPYLQQPILMGADYVVHSATKYLGGHGDLLAGAVCGPKEIIDQVRFYGVKDMTGACLSPQDAQLILRGIKTLHLRMKQHCASAQIVAEMLQGHPLVQNVYYPGLKTDPGHEIIKRNCKGFGGMIAVELRGGLDAGRDFLNHLQLFIRAVSLGDCESLAQHPATMTHSTYTPEERAEHGITDGLVRLSIGLEEVEDLLEDLTQALNATMATKAA